MRFRLGILVCFLLALPALAQQPPLTRDQTRELVRASLARYGMKDLNTEFRQSDKQPYNFVGLLKTGLKNSDSVEIVVSITADQTIGFRIFPHFNGAYINLDKVKDANGLMRKMLYFNDRNFLFWGADGSSDVFSGYTFTLESGYPEEAFHIVLRSITTLDKFVGEMRPFIDGSAAAP
jgi:hypothetical protein